MLTKKQMETGVSGANGVFGFGRVVQRLSVFLILLFCSTVWAAPLATKGVLDLRGGDFVARGVVPLDGEWAFYPGQLLNPEALASLPATSSVEHIVLPAPWDAFEKNGRRLEGMGVATFRLQVLLDRQETHLALRLADVHSAYRLWLNGKLVSSKGTVADRQQLEVADAAIDLPVFHSDGTSLELVLEVSNHLYRDGGVISSILLGTEQGIQEYQIRRWGITLFFVGALLMMGCYHLVFFAFRRTNGSPLYFGFYCLLWMSNFIASNASDWVARLFFVDVSLELLQRVDSFCFFLSVPVGYLFFRSLYPQEFSRYGLWFAQAMAGVGVLVALLAPVSTLLAFIPYYYLISAVLIVYSLIALINARRQNREGAGFILVGFFALGLIAANDMLCDLGLIQSVFLIHVGMFCFIISQGFALALIFSRTFSAVERLSFELEGRNQALQTEIVERSRLEREIVNVSENERRCLSHDLHDGLCQQLTAARLHCSVLERKPVDAPLGAGELNRLSALLEGAVNVAYGLARGLWPIERDQYGMNAFLEEYCRRLAEAHNMEISVQQARSCELCGTESVTHLYRIAQEAIANAVKHAKASRIEVALDCVSEHAVMALSVRDNGVGRKRAAPSPGGLGVQIMAHRARMIGGQLLIEDAEGGGTVVHCKMHCAYCAALS